MASAKTKKIGILAVVAAVLVCAGAAAFLWRHKASPPTAVSKASKAYAVMQPHNCGEAMPTITKLQPSELKDADAIAMLNYRSGCYMSEKQYSKALSDSKLLRTYYVKQNNQEEVANTDNQISLINALIASADKKAVPHHEDITPEFAKQLEEEN